jgi:hypothetical protein
MDLDELEMKLAKKQKLLEHLRGIKAQYDQQRIESDVKLSLLKSIRTELSDVSSQIQKEKITNLMSLEELEISLAKPEAVIAT